MNIPSDDDSGLAAGVVVAGCSMFPVNNEFAGCAAGCCSPVNNEFDVGEVAAAVVGVKLNGFAPVAGAPVCAWGNENMF